MFLYSESKQENKNKKTIIFSKDKLVEALTSLVFHYTSLANCYEIITQNKIFLQSALGGMSDNYGNGKMFYLSTTRQRSNLSGYKRQTRGVARLELDGDKLNQRFKGKPLDYWGKGYRNVDNFEMEDRLLSNESQIYPASAYIKRIDLFINDEDEYQLNVATNILYGIPNAYYGKVFAYSNIDDFNRQSDNTINQQLIDRVSNGYTPAKEIGFGNTNRSLVEAIGLFGHLYCLQFKNFEQGKNEYINLLRANGLEDFLKYKSVFNKIQNGSMGGIWGIIDELSLYMHNISRKPNEKSQRFVKLVSKFFNQNNLKSYKDFYSFLVDKGAGNQSDRDVFYQFNKDGIQMMTAIGNGGYPSILIPDPNKTSFWNIFRDRERFITELYNIIEMNHYRDGYGEMEKFEKYLQHLAKNETSVNEMLAILDKLGLSEEEKDDLLNGMKFEMSNIKYGDTYNFHLPDYYKHKDWKKDSDDIAKLFMSRK